MILHLIDFDKMSWAPLVDGIDLTNVRMTPRFIVDISVRTTNRQLLYLGTPAYVSLDNNIAANEIEELSSDHHNDYLT